MYCQKIRYDQQSWLQQVQYLKDHSDVEFSHGLCLECLKEHYSEVMGGRSGS